MHFFAKEQGQAGVEFVALLPLVVLVGLALWQMVLAGQAIWLVGSAADAAARETAVSGDKKAIEKVAAARLPNYLEKGLRIRPGEASGAVKVSIAVPAVLVGGELVRVGATAHFEPQQSG